MTFDTASLRITPEILSLIAEIDELKGASRAIGRIAPDRLSGLRRVATIESIGVDFRQKRTVFDCILSEELTQKMPYRARAPTLSIGSIRHEIQRVAPASPPHVKTTVTSIARVLGLSPESVGKTVQSNLRSLLG